MSSWKGNSSLYNPLKFDLIKKTVSFIKIDTEENNMPSLSQLRELVADDDDDLEELDGSDMDVEPRSQDDVCLDELPALASDIRLKIITCRGFINLIT